MARKIRNLRKLKWQWLFAMVAGVLLLAGCGGGGGGGGGGTAPVDTADARFEFTLSAFDPDAVAPSGGLSAPTSTQALIISVEGTILAVNQVNGEEHKFNFAVEVDPGAFEVTDVELPLPPGTYDVFFLMDTESAADPDIMIQYAAITGSWIILEGQNVVPMLIAPLIGQTVSDLDQLKRLMEFEFRFTDEEVQKLKAADNPQFSISVDGDESRFAINPATGLTTAYAVLEAGTYDFVVTFFDGDVQISDPQVITVIIPEEGGKTKIEVNLKPSANAGSNRSVHQGDTVTLLGNASFSTGGLLTYQWSFDSVPEGSTAELIGADTVDPTFVADVEGDYVLQLIVIDANGVASDPIFVTVSTFNTKPVADPGEDLEIIEVGDPIIVDGSESFDDDGDDLRYFWTITERPEGSTAVIEDPTLPTLTFTPDVAGTYVLSLVVTDEFDAVSDEQTVTITSANMKPVAVAGSDQSVTVGTRVTLSGSGSFDNDGDTLTYLWRQTSGPPVDDLTDLTVKEISFTPTVADTYIFFLIVDDGDASSDPDESSSVTVVAHMTLHPAIFILGILIGVIEDDVLIPNGDFKHSQHRKTLVNKIQSVIHKLDEGNLESAKNKLEGDILRKVDGCATSEDPENPEPDRHDWIITCDAQGDEPGEVYPLVKDAIKSIEDSLAGI